MNLLALFTLLHNVSNSSMLQNHDISKTGIQTIERKTRLGEIFAK